MKNIWLVARHEIMLFPEVNFFPQESLSYSAMLQLKNSIISIKPHMIRYNGYNSLKILIKYALSSRETRNAVIPGIKGRIAARPYRDTHLKNAEKVEKFRVVPETGKWVKFKVKMQELKHCQSLEEAMQKWTCKNSRLVYARQAQLIGTHKGLVRKILHARHQNLKNMRLNALVTKVHQDILSKGL